MGKFEKGQWVRRTIGSSLATKAGIHEAGFVGQVAEVVPDTYGAELVFTNGHRGIADKYEPWAPKVGDRVTANDTTRVNLERHWNEHFRRSEGDIINGALVVTSVAEKNTGSNIGLSNKDGRSFFFMPESTLRPADPASATLTIEAGKFYKTRDGRKVLVKKNGTNAQWPWYHDCARDGYHGVDKDGKSCVNSASDDLVAEWVDEPKASNDNGATLGDILQSAIGETVTVKISQPKFKVGDRVLSTEDGPTRGLSGTIIVDDGSRVPYRVRFDNWHHGNGANDNEWWLCANEVTSAPVAAHTPTAIVCLIENGQPKPSTTPHVHADEAKAGKEAERLAGVYKGKEFGVFVLTSSTSQPAPVYKHEWQRLAANGNKIGAIKELREIASLDLLSAKKAVEVFIEKAA